MNDKRVLIGLSGGINSAAVLCWFIEQGVMPLELHLYYAHFKQHSPDTAKFVIEDKDQYYSTFMRDDIGQESTCEACKF